MRLLPRAARLTWDRIDPLAKGIGFLRDSLPHLMQNARCIAASHRFRTLGEAQLSGFTLRKADASLFSHARHLPISD